ncbi:hypothetical protein PVK06_039863 [Gossypium arboreum]|uniref:Uncharacterized protein n=1 Tax=Gossypium arboreum TaxID=29729 RepID=A0ABR0N6Q3_GOSAR|nr:hypothetical protein PVK06_039863 [Gossypium arboreum]
MFRGYKLVLALISALVEIWRPKTHFPPFMRQVYNHTRGRSPTFGFADGWTSHQGICDRSSFGPGYDYHFYIPSSSVGGNEFVTTVRPEVAAQGGNAREGQQRLSGQFTPLILVQFSKPIFFPQAPQHYEPSPHMTGSSVLAEPHVRINADKCTATDDDTDTDAHVVFDNNVDAGTFPMYPGFGAFYGYTLIVTQTSCASLFYKGGSSSQPSDVGVEDGVVIDPEGR